jgi:hypothetical protein
MAHKINNQAKGWAKNGHTEYKQFTGKAIFTADLA